MHDLRHDLSAAVRGEVWVDAARRSAYAHDASNYRQVPVAVVAPCDDADVAAAVGVARAHGVPVLPRGAGTSLAGQTVGAAVVLDFSRHMRSVVSVDLERRTARVQPGVVRDRLAARVARHGLTFGPDTSTHAWATVGGMLGNNSCGVHSLTAGRTSDNTVELDVLLYDGTRLRVGRDLVTDERLRARLLALRDRVEADVRAGFPAIPRRVSGYNLDELLPERGFHVARALVGSEGTLATILEAEVALVPRAAHRALAVIGHPTILEAADRVPEVLALRPSGLEGIDMARVRPRPAGLPHGDGWLLAEFEADTAFAAAERARRVRGAEVTVVTEPREQRLVWALRERGVRPAGVAFPGWEDAAVPPERVGPYLRDFQALLDAHGYSAALFGHFGDGCIHCRIDFDLHTARGVRAWRAFLDEAADLVVAYGGSLSGEHGDGRARSELLPRMFGPAVIGAFAELKAIFDPEGGMNPGIVVEPPPVTAALKPRGVSGCVGAGNCRDPHAGTMCPSFAATLDEKHTTRGRARVLDDLLSGAGAAEGLRAADVVSALDLCLSCKGCKAECPASVDMAALKADFLASHYRRRLRPRAAYSMGLIMFAARAGRLANVVAAAPLARRAAGITDARPLPRFRRPFRGSWRDRPGPGEPVLLFADTFNDHFHPEVLRDAAAVLERAGCSVAVPGGFACCGRPLFDSGMLGLARRLLRRTARLVGDGDAPVVVLEPSCASTFRDELPRMVPEAAGLAERVVTLAELLERRGWQPPALERPVVLHGHCHHRATLGLDPDAALLRATGAAVTVPDTGCCGLAGAFGFERGKDAISRDIAAARFLPAIESAPEDALIVADGFSCRTQLEHLSDRRALHLAQVLVGSRR